MCSFVSACSPTSICALLYLQNTFSYLINLQVRYDPGVSAPVCLEEEGIFNGLPELSSMPRTASYDLVENSELYLELQDLTAPLNPQTGLQDLTAPFNPQTGLHDLTSPFNPQTGLQDLTAPLNPQTGNRNDPRSSSFLYNQGHFDFSGGNDDDPYGFSASMRHRPKM